jgi:chorismate synthase
LALSVPEVQHHLNRRRPGQSQLTTPRTEADEIELLSGVYQGVTTGAPIAFLLRNRDARPSDYDSLAHSFRPGHADLTYALKYQHRDPTGGGRSSARATAPWVAAGAIARQFLAKQFPSFQCLAWVSQVESLAMPTDAYPETEAEVEASPTRCPHPETAQRMETLIGQAANEGDTLGAVVSGRIAGLPPGLGEPLFGKLHAQLGHALLSINACKGFEVGSGFGGATRKGSQHNDPLSFSDGRFAHVKNDAGGVLGGISTGAPVTFRCAFKPVSTLRLPQQTVDQAGNPITLQARGRHDPCVAPRAVPIVEAMACLVVADLALAQRASAPLLPL